MIVYDRFHYAAPPRCATNWFRQAAAAAGLGSRSHTGVHDPHTPGSAVLTVSTVRGPVEWAASYYLGLQGGTIGVGCVDVFSPHARAAGNINDFIDAFTAEIPGAIGRMFASYNADTVLRVEDLPHAACELFDAAGGQSGPVRAMGPVNVYHGQVAIIGRRQRDAILRTERDFCSLYDY